jgi:pimeloyl-ACP methyl ester carboxylesterase
MTSQPDRLAHEISGSGPPVLLIHGLGASRRWWSATTPALSDRFTVIAVDLVGFGDSRGRFHLRRAARHVEELLDALGVKRGGVVGHSMGGLVAARLAFQAPDRVSRLVLVDAPLLPFSWGLSRHALNLLRAGRHLPPEYRSLVAGDYLRAGPRSMALGIRGILGLDLSRQLGRIRAPCLLLWGDRDPLVPISVGRQAAELIPNARLAVMSGVGHAPMWEQPAEFVRIVGDFLTSDTDTNGTVPIRP